MCLFIYRYRVFDIANYSCICLHRFKTILAFVKSMSYKRYRESAISKVDCIYLLIY